MGSILIWVLHECHKVENCWLKAFQKLKKNISIVGKLLDKNDIAILRVDKGFEKSALVKPISPFSDTSDYPSGEILNHSRYVFTLHRIT
jgi:hypothetical protein